MQLSLLTVEFAAVTTKKAVLVLQKAFMNFSKKPYKCQWTSRYGLSNEDSLISDITVISQ